MVTTHHVKSVNEARPQQGLRSVQLAWLLAITIALTTVLVFLPVRHFGYVNYDDGDYVKGNREVQQGLTAHSLYWAFTTGHAANWHPLTWISHMLDFAMFGDNFGLHHMTNLVLHVGNAVLLFLLVRKWTGATWRSAFIAAIFALHPMHVESVAWLSERKDVLSGLFWILTLFFYARFSFKRKAAGNGAHFDYLIALVMFSLGLMSKPMLVTLPCVLILLDFWPLGRFENSERSISRFRNSEIARLLIEKIPFFGLAFLSSAVTFYVQRKGGAVASIETLSFGARLANAMVSYLRYTKKLFWPTDLAVLYPHPGHWPTVLVAVSVVFVVAVIVLAVSQWRRRPYLLVGSLWFFGSLVPVIGLVQVGIQSMADRYMYIPAIGFSIALTWWLVEVSSRWSFLSKTTGAMGILTVVACVPITRIQLGFWRDSEALFGRTVAVTKDNYLAWNNLGFSLPKSRAKEAIECYRRSVAIKSDYVDALNNLGHALAEQGDVREALPLYERALKQDPKHADVNNNYGNALAEIGQVDAAIGYYLVALKSNTNHADAHNNLGIAMAMRGNMESAMFHLKRAVELDPGKASAHSNLGNAYAVQHKLEEATTQYREALRLKPDEAQVHNNLGNVLSEQQKYSEAIEHYKLALQLNANNPEAHYNLSLALIHDRQNDEAVDHLKQALQLRRNYPEAQRQLNHLTRQ